MRAVAIFITAVSALLLTITFAGPTPPPLALHSHSDLNVPATLAGRELAHEPRFSTRPSINCSFSPLPPRHLPSRGNPHPIYVPAPNSRIYVIVRAIVPIAGSVIHELLLSVYEKLAAYVRETAETADAPLHSGGFDSGTPYYVSARNANNHQITYRVMCKALEAMADWMEINGDAMVSYEIWDGDNLVGKGLVGREGTGS